MNKTETQDSVSVTKEISSQYVNIDKPLIITKHIWKLQ